MEKFVFSVQFFKIAFANLSVCGFVQAQDLNADVLLIKGLMRLSFVCSYREMTTQEVLKGFKTDDCITDSFRRQV